MVLWNWLIATHNRGVKHRGEIGPLCKLVSKYGLENECSELNKDGIKLVARAYGCVLSPLELHVRLMLLLIRWRNDGGFAGWIPCVRIYHADAVSQMFSYKIGAITVFPIPYQDGQALVM